ncbi:YciI family protein [Rhizobium jaguaris]|uniref:YciI family protein n=1 Tax=Rhizobium jaguaris TaxID=1312183 RepID=UPI0039BF8E8F
MQYMLLVYRSEAKYKNATKEQKAETFAAYAAYTEILKKAGAFVAGSGLQDSSTATVVRAPDGGPTVLNGPYIESSEQLGGYYLIEAADLDGAIAWAARCPGARQDTVEVRPLMVY